MPILLSTPYNPGDLDPGQSYSHVEAVQVRVERPRSNAEVIFGYGSWDGSAFSEGKAKRGVVTISNGDWNAFESLITNNGEAAVDGLVRAACQYLLDKTIIDGAIV